LKRIKKYLCVLLAAACLLPRVSGNGERKYLALTFDDGPSGGITESLLAVLEEYDARATFFLCGYRMEQWPELVTSMAEAGHEVGVHGCSHLYFTQMTEQTLREELVGTAETVARLTGQTPTLLRPPGGLHNAAVRQQAEELGMSLMLWNVDPEDWDPHKRQQAAETVISGIKDGDVVLLHDLSADNVQTVREILRRLRDRGFIFVTVSQLAQLRGTALLPGKIYGSFPEKTNK